MNCFHHILTPGNLIVAATMLLASSVFATSFDAGDKDFPGQLSKRKAAVLREAIKTIQASEARPELQSIR